MRLISFLLCLAYLNVTVAQSEPTTEIDAGTADSLDSSSLDKDIGKEKSSWVGFDDDGTLFDLGGFIEQEIGYSFERDEFQLSKIRTSVGLDIESNFDSNWKFKVNASAWYDAAYRAEGRDKFTDETLSTYETDFRFKEAYVDVDLTSWMNLRVGRQYFSWGETTGVTQISDIGNPRDLKELGLQDIEDARLPVGSTKLTLYGTSWEYNLIAIHEFRANEFGTEGSEFDPLLALRNEQTVIQNPVEPADSLSGNGILTRLFLSQSWGDISFFWGNPYYHLPALSLESFDNNTGISTYRPEFKRIEAYGVFGSVILGSWSLLFDVARKKGFPVTVSPDYIGEQLRAGNGSAIAWKPRRVLQSMLGFEYSGLSETIVSMEYLRTYIEDYESILDEDETTEQISLYISREFMHDTLTTTFWVSHDLNDDSNQYRIDVEYAYSDNLSYSLGINGIDAGNRDSFFYNYRDTDRLTLGIKYSF